MIALEINKLKTFIDLAHTLDFSQTAANLYMTQSCVSKQIKSLEKELGYILFLREKRNVSLTKYGQILLPKAVKIVQLNNEVLANLTSDHRSDKQLIIGVIPTFRKYFFFKSVKAFQKLHPTVNLIIQECESSQFVNLLEQRKIDLAFVRTFNQTNVSYDEIALGKEAFKVCLSSANPLSNRKVIDLSNLKDLPFGMLDKSSKLYQPVLDLCIQSGFKPKITFISNRISSIQKMVADQNGAAILMPPAKVQKGVCFLPLQPTRISKLLLLRQKDNHRKIVDQFWQFLQTRYSKLE